MALSPTPELCLAQIEVTSPISIGLALLLTVFRWLAKIPLSWMQSLGAALGVMVWWSSRRYRLQFNANAKLLNLSARERHQAIVNAGIMLAELPWMWLRNPSITTAERVSWDGLELFEAALAQGRGVIILSPHLGCWEIGAQMVAERFGPTHGPMLAMYRPPRKTWLAPLVQGARQREHLQTVPASPQGIRSIVRCLKRGGFTAVLPDQVPPEGQGIWSRFLGQPAYTMTLAVKLAEQTGARLLMCWCERKPKGQYVGHLSALSEFDALQGQDRSLENLVQAMNDGVERLVKSAPEQYLWGYARFKKPRHLARIQASSESGESQ
jgi:KDO2-lipid IV(A) lauroyltransferase